MVLETKLLALRPFVLSDASEVARLCADREMAQYTQNIPHPYELSSATEWIASHPGLIEHGDLYPFAITLKESGRLCGAVSLGINKNYEKAELGYWVGKEFWGNGYATEACRAILRFAFRELKLNRVSSHHFTDNPGSGRVMQKLGMQLEGRLRQSYKKWGKFHDTDHYAILRAEYAD